MDTENLEQRSAEWVAARLGKVTASRVADVMARTKTGYGASRANYMAELLCERLTNTQAYRFTSAEMQRGTDLEPEARTAYSFIHSKTVEETGFVIHPRIANFGASPDGLIGEDGLVEIKCPSSATHIEYLLSGDVPGKYNTQMQAQMACTGRAWCDFVSYDSRLPEELHLFVRRVKRDPAFIATMEQEIRTFLAELDAMESKLRNLAEAA